MDAPSFKEVVTLLLKVIWEFIHAGFRLIVPYPKKNISGEIVLVTGSAHGIGRELALSFARYGATLVLWDVNKDGNEATADEVRKQGGTAHAYLCDVSNTDDVKRVAERVRRDVGDVTILVNNAGILHGLDLLQLTDQQIRKTIEINTMAHFWTVREFLPKMLEFDHGHIVTISSMSGFYGASYLVDYSTSKYAVRGFTEALAEEIRRLGKTQIKTTTVFPMFVDTGLVTGIDQRFEKQLTPQQVAKATVSGVLRNRLHVFVPRKCDFTARLKMFLPTKVINLLIDFGNSKIQLQEKKSK